MGQVISRFQQVKRLPDFVDAGGQCVTLSAVTTAAESTNPRPIDYFDGYLYGIVGTVLHRSADMGTTWSSVQDTNIGSINRLAKCSDGEILISNGGNIYKSSGWAANPSTATFSIVASATAGGNAAFLQWGLDGDSTGTKFIAVEYAGLPYWAQSRKALISLDSGSTWTLKYDSLVRYGEAANESSHIHACCYDEWNDRFWLSEGHGDPVGIYFSDDDGDTWTKCLGEYPRGATPTTFTATEYGIVMGTDSPETGLWLMPNVPDPTNQDARQLVSFRHSVTTYANSHFATRSFRDPDTGIVYVCFETSLTGAPTFIAASDGRSGSIIYRGTSTTGDKILQVVAAQDKLAAYYVDGGGASAKHLYARTSVGLAVPDVHVEDTGYVLGGSVTDFTSTAVGRASTAGTANRCTVVGVGASVNDNDVEGGVAIGYGARVDGTNSICIGDSVNPSGSGGVFIGQTVTATGNFQVAIGTNVDVGAEGAVAIGSSADAGEAAAVAVGLTAVAGVQAVCVGSSSTAGTQGVAVGYDATTAASQAVAIGHTSDADNHGVAIGYGTVSGQFGVAIGRNAAQGSTAFAITAVGNSSSVTGNYGTSVGYAAVCSHANSVALGDQVTTTAANQIKAGARHIELTEMTEPDAPATNSGRLYLKDDGGGKTQLCVRFPTGAVQVIATEP